MKTAAQGSNVELAHAESVVACTNGSGTIYHLIDVNLAGIGGLNQVK